jgi:ectoine hydroxylase-related dioxygenase (phytanoyl-CoA dioxygenase family)
MDISEYGASPNADGVVSDLARFDLFKHAIELEAYGMTVVPSAKMRSAPDFAARLREAIIRVYEKRTGVVVGDPSTAPASAAPRSGKGWDLIEEDEVFVEAAINPALLTLVRWLLGQSAIFGGQTWIIKGEDGPPLGLHSDSHGVPPGAGTIAHMCNASWLCTDYADADGGPTVFVPGSHRFGRATLPHEGRLDDTPFKTFPLIGEAGSLAIWNGFTWHGAAPRRKPGLRVTLVQNYFRPYMRTMANYAGRISPQLLQKYPELERVVGKPLYPYDDPQGPDWSRVAPTMRAGTDPFA